MQNIFRTTQRTMRNTRFLTWRVILTCHTPHTCHTPSLFEFSDPSAFAPIQLIGPPCFLSLSLSTVASFSSSSTGKFQISLFNCQRISCTYFLSNRLITHLNRIHTCSFIQNSMANTYNTHIQMCWCRPTYIDLSRQILVTFTYLNFSFFFPVLNPKGKESQLIKSKYNIGESSSFRFQIRVTFTYLIFCVVNPKGSNDSWLSSNINLANVEHWTLRLYTPVLVSFSNQGFVLCRLLFEGLFGDGK